GTLRFPSAEDAFGEDAAAYDPGPRGRARPGRPHHDRGPRGFRADQNCAQVTLRSRAKTVAQRESYMALHIDYYVRWKNFRAFADTNWIVIKPLTILIGPNNAGKTSMTAPLLLMSQTLWSKD